MGVLLGSGGMEGFLAVCFSLGVFIDVWLGLESGVVNDGISPTRHRED